MDGLRVIILIAATIVQMVIGELEGKYEIYCLRGEDNAFFRGDDRLE